VSDGDEEDDGGLGVAGGGAWGAALAIAAASSGRAATLWGRDAARMSEMARSRRHPALPGARLPEAVAVTADPAALNGRGVLVLATPAQTMAGLLDLLSGAGISPGIAVVAAKGIERQSGDTLPAVLARRWPAVRPAILSGPTFAAELARGLPAAATVAADDMATARRVADRFAGGRLRLYLSGDMTGVALGGAVKNVLAIAAGAVMGAELGANARAAVISRGLAEMQRLGRAMGARAETLSGLSGLGDVVLSCTDAASRNYSLGLALGRGGPRPAALAEGALTVGPLLTLAERKGVELPIARAVDAVVNRGVPIAETVAALLARPDGPE
jgi:glycerol-3-phosphate dehydrogenase (NAD(P)+)